MKTTVTTKSLFRLLVAAWLAVGLLGSPCTAQAGNPALVRSVTAPVRELPPVNQLLFEEIAQRAKEKALFGVRIAPDISPVFNPPQVLISALWQLRSAPAIQTEWLNRLTAPYLTHEERAVALKEFEAFLADTNDLARLLPRHPDNHRNLWERFHNRYMPHVPKAEKSRRDRHDPDQVARAFRRIKRAEAVFEKALMVRVAAEHAGITGENIALYGRELLKIMDAPENLSLAHTIISNADLPRERVRGILATLAKDPAAAREAFEASVKPVEKTQDSNATP